VFTKLFPLWVSLSAIIALINPVLFIWFSGPWITYGLGGIMLGMGLTLQWQDFNQIFQTPKWVFLGLLLQFSLMPLMGWCLGVFFELPPFFAVGLILVASCPGGTASNVIAYLARANVALSVAMTTCSTLAGIILTPYLTASLSGNYLSVDAWGLFYSTVKVVASSDFRRHFQSIFPKIHQKGDPFCAPSSGIINCINRCKYYRTRKRDYFERWFKFNFSHHDFTSFWFYIRLCA